MHDTSLAPRDIKQAGAKAQAYSRSVGRLRWILPALVFAGLAALFFWPKLNEPFSTTAPPVVPGLVVEGLHLTGRDSKDQPYELTAARVIQEGALSSIVDLEGPRGSITLQDGSWIFGGALRGRYDQKTEKVWFGEAVEFFHDAGGHIVAHDLFIDIKKSVAWSEKSVVFQSDFGEITGSGLRILEAGKIIVFAGPATAHLQWKNETKQSKLSVNTFKAP